MTAGNFHTAVRRSCRADPGLPGTGRRPRCHPLARVVSSAVYGNDPLLMGIAPAWALPLALRRAGLTPEQIDIWEIHEAFSAQALGVLRELPNQLDGFEVPDDKLTPNGGAVAIGHPFGATGVRYALTLATELRERHLRYGAIGVCIGSGQGVAMILENRKPPDREFPPALHIH